MSEQARGDQRIKEIGNEGRRRILDAAEELFAERGFNGTSFIEISRRSGISRGSIPWHFQNKDGLLVAVLERVIERSMTTDADIDPAELSMDVAMKEFHELTVSSRPGLLWVLLAEALAAEGVVREVYVNFFRRRRESLLTYLTTHSGWENLDVADREAMAVLLYAALVGIQIQWQMDPEQVDLTRVLRLFAALADNRLPTGKSPGRRRAGSRAT